MPNHRTLSRIALASWAVTTGALLAELIAGGLEALVTYCVGLSVTTTVVASLKYLQTTAIVPVREAFMHGYQLATQHAAQARAAQLEADTARILRPPAGVWTATGQQTADGTMPQEQPRPHRRGPSPSRSR